MKRTARPQWGRFLSIILILMLLMGGRLSLAAQQAEYKSAVLMDYETGQILFEKNPHQHVIPASIVKMMVLLLVMERLDSGELHLSDIVTVSAWASKIGGHQVYLAEGETFRLEELLKAIAISSANDAATTVAEFVAGGADLFVDMMNTRAKELGMNNTFFANEHGLPPDPGQKENYTSAYDVAILGRELLKHPRILTWTSILEDTFRNGTFTLTNTNRQLLRNYRGVDGLKTGFHPRGADFSICVSAKRQNRRLIAVVMGAPRKEERYQTVKELLNLGFTQYERVMVLRKGFSVGEPLRISKGKKLTTTLVASNNAVVLVKKGQAEQVRQDIHIPVHEIVAPANRGTPFGTATVFVDEQPIVSVDLVVEEDLEKGSLVDRIKLWIVDKVS